jgi:hypothetical protein
MEIKGHYTHKDLMIMQHENAGLVFDSLIKTIKPARILEIGTATGGLTLLLRELLNANELKNTILRTYDVYEPKYLMYHLSDECVIDIRVKSVFNEHYNDFSEEGKNEINDFINQSGVTLVLCDGGNKINEFKLISPLLKSGDVIMAHDYSYSKEVFEERVNNKIWNWCEITNSDIEDTVIKNNLESFMEDEFNNIVWTCKIKK